MSFRLRICKNPTNDLLRDTFHATPVNPPEAAVQPLLIFAMRDGKAQRRGQFQYLLDGGKKLKIKPVAQKVSDTALDRTKKIEIGAGLKIMEALLAGFKIDTAPVTFALNTAREISFSFTNVERLSIDLNELGKELSGRKLDLANASTGIFTQAEDPHTMLLVSSVLVSKDLEINVESTSDSNFKINVDALQDYIAGANLKVKASKHGETKIRFEGEEALTFAFSCVRVGFDPKTGENLQIGEEVSVRSGKKKGDDVIEPASVVLDDDMRRPGFLSWD